MPILGTIASSWRNVVVDGSFESIATATGTGSNQVITFNNIPSTYTHLQIRCSAPTTGLGGTGIYGGWFNINNDTASNYTDHSLYGDGTSAATYIVVPRSSMGLYVYSTTTTNSTANIIDFLDYKNTNKFKTVRSLCGGDVNGSGSVLLQSGLWRSTSAITRIDFYLNQGFGTHYFANGAHFALYGIKTV